MEGKLENLIPISITEESDVLISARDLHDFLEIKTNFRIWYPRMIDYGFVEKEDYQKVYEKTIPWEDSKGWWIIWWMWIWQRK